MSERPTAADLIEAARHSVKTHLIPVLSGEARKQATMVARALAMVARDLADDGQTDRQAVTLWTSVYPDLVDAPQPAEVLDARIAADIRSGAFDAQPMRDTVEDVLMRHAALKLRLSNREFLHAADSS